MQLHQKRLLFLLLMLALLSAVACKTVERLAAPTTISAAGTSLPVPSLSPTASSSPTKTPTHPPTTAPTATTSPTATNIPPSLTPIPTRGNSARQLRVFRQLWEAVNENYLYPDFNGLDWGGVYDQYRQKINAGLSDEAFYQAMDEMIFSLGDQHSVFFSPAEADELDAEFEGSYDYVGIGVYTSVVMERRRVTIIVVFPDGPADQAGLKPHDSILEIDGQPVIEEGFSRMSQLRGAVGSQVTLTVQSPGETPRQVTLERRRVTGQLPVPYQIIETAAGKRIGYILLVTFNDNTVDEQVGQALEAMNAESPLDGLIIDNRFNGGGASNVFNNTLAYFSDGMLGNFIRREQKRPLQVAGVDIGGSQDIPLIVLVGRETASFGEIFCGVLQDNGRAYLIGEQSNGNVEILRVYTFVDGSRAWIAVETFQPLNNPEQDWEQTGILPDLTAPNNWDETTLEQDAAILAALKYLDSITADS